MPSAMSFLYQTAVLVFSPKLHMLAGRVTGIPGTLDTSSCRIHAKRPATPKKSLAAALWRPRTAHFYYEDTPLLGFSSYTAQAVYLAYLGAIPYARVVVAVACALYLANMYGVVDNLRMVLMFDALLLWVAANVARAADALFLDKVVGPLLERLPAAVPKKVSAPASVPDKTKSDGADENTAAIDAPTKTSVGANKYKVSWFETAVVVLALVMAVSCYFACTFKALVWMQYHAFSSINVVLPVELVYLAIANQAVVIVNRCVFGSSKQPYTKCACVLVVKPVREEKADVSSVRVSGSKEKIRNVSLAETLVASDYEKDCGDDEYDDDDSDGYFDNDDTWADYHSVSDSIAEDDLEEVHADYE